MPHFADGFLTIRGMCNDLGDHRIVVRRNPAARKYVCIDADTIAETEVQPVDVTRSRHEIFSRVLRVDPAFDSKAVHLYIFLPDGESIEQCHLKLETDDVDSGNHLGNRMLHLHPRVHLHEVERILFLDVQVFDGACTGIPDPADGGRRPLRTIRTRRIGKDTGRRLLYQLLIIALYRTVTLKKMHCVPIAVTHDLNFDVPRFWNIFLYIDPIFAERILRLFSGIFVLLFEGLFIMHETHPFSAAAKDGLDDDREADIFCDFLHFIDAFHNSFAARDDRDARRFHGLS